MSDRCFNFSPGPAMLPLPVVETVKANLLNYRDSGLGLMEMSHRGSEFEAIIGEAEQRLRALLSIGSEYAVLFTTGGATQQFSMVPMNLLTPGTVGSYILTGLWAEKALEEAKKYGDTHVAGSTKSEGYVRLPEQFVVPENAAYVHFTSNNTVIGSQLIGEPAGLPPETVLVCDASSDLLHRKIDVSRYGLIYAGAQKNLGTAGVTLVIIRRDLLKRSRQGLPLMMDYNTFATSQSLYNTPPTLPIYVLGEVLRWIETTGGLDAMEERNKRKAALLYDALDASDFYEPVVDRSCRSRMNVTFRIANRALEDTFVKEAEAARLSGLKGHRMVGGLRASIYNAFPESGVKALVEFMTDFARRHRQ